jgi:hypothetical protein
MYRRLGMIRIGSQTEPWRTVPHAADTVRAGSTVNVRGGVYEELVSIKASGNAGIHCFSELSRRDGCSRRRAVHSLPQTGRTYYSQQSYVRVEGFEIRNFRTR